MVIYKKYNIYHLSFPIDLLDLLTIYVNLQNSDLLGSELTIYRGNHDYFNVKAVVNPVVNLPQ